MLGPAGTGKTMMAKALPGILPPMTTEQAIEVTRIYSSAGELDAKEGLVSVRPVRSPHHTASAPAIVGGGVVPRAGEISLAHHGVLFLDELPEFSRPVLETMRQPLEDHVVTIARAHGSVRFPASFMLVAAMNPTPRGDIAPGEVGQREMDRYLSRLSGPLLDRVDLHVEAPAVPWKELSTAKTGTSTAQMREQVLKARDFSRPRQGEKPNARLSGRELDVMMVLDDPARTLLEQAMVQLGLSARAYDKIRRVSRTIADIEGAQSVRAEHIAEAVQYRLLDRRL
ncbi:MAG: ATP-binding protein [Phycisphaerales bacterium]|nr:ATP-binding protein [Phycisphaerales bacterium]